MAKKKSSQNSQNSDKDLELLVHKYSRIYIDDDKDSELKRDDEENMDFVLYDARRVAYPYYKTQVFYKVAKVLEVHPIILEILNIIAETHRMQDKNNVTTLLAITQLDSDIFYSIMSDLETKGYIEKIENGILKLSKNGRELLNKGRERVIESSSAFVKIDAILGDVVEVAPFATGKRGINMDDRVYKDAIELKPDSQKRPRIQELHKTFKQNLSLEQVLQEGLRGLDDREETSAENEESKTRVEYEIVEIDDIKESRKFFENYFCLFYKSEYEEEKILVINDNNEIDYNATKLFETLIDRSCFGPNENSAYFKNIERFSKLSQEKIQQEIDLRPDITDGITLETVEHKAYLLYALRNAEDAIYIQSPWVRHNILKEYEKDIESALKKGVRVFIKYGIKPRNKQEKAVIDIESQNIFDKWVKEYENFKIIADDDHSKILICDKLFMIIGSFNWLSFGGAKDRDGDTRGERSTVIKDNKASINRQIEDFKKKHNKQKPVAKNA